MPRPFPSRRRPAFEPADVLPQLLVTAVVLVALAASALTARSSGEGSAGSPDPPATEPPAGAPPASSSSATRSPAGGIDGEEAGGACEAAVRALAAALLDPGAPVADVTGGPEVAGPEAGTSSGGAGPAAGTSSGGAGPAAGTSSGGAGPAASRADGVVPAEVLDRWRSTLPDRSVDLEALVGSPPAPDRAVTEAIVDDLEALVAPPPAPDRAVTDAIDEAVAERCAPPAVPPHP